MKASVARRFAAFALVIAAFLVILVWYFPGTPEPGFFIHLLYDPVFGLGMLFGFAILMVMFVVSESFPGKSSA